MAAGPPDGKAVGQAAPRLALWAGLSPAVHLRRPDRELPFPFGAPGTTLVARGRQALWLGVAALGLRPGDEVLAPAYCCGAEVEALARRGLACRFHDATPTLAPDPAELDALCGPRTRALLLIHYLGFPQDAAAWRAWCDDRDLLLIEDCAHAWPASAGGRPLGSFGDLAIFSLHKPIPLAAGGALHVRAKAAAPPEREDGVAAGAVLRRHAVWAAGRSRAAGALVEAARRRRPYAGDAGLGDPDAPVPASTRYLLARLAPEAAAA
ncbi:MAG: DegT/DnrJ/EryC1/StrS family aminotransferase, partial [Solirubrobacterales bacterium]|nr:DegT/DnrJ/EryC1/StrS family aminotransferase [Solirubrobacterales bacterium]